MLPSLCLAMAAIPSVSRIWRASVDARIVPRVAGRTANAIGRASGQRLILGFRAASWQHRYRDCGTLVLSGRCGHGTPCRGRRQVAARKEPPVAGACMVGEVLG